MRVCDFVVADAARCVRVVCMQDMSVTVLCKARDLGGIRWRLGRVRVLIF